MLLWILPIFAGYKYWGRWRQQQQVGRTCSPRDRYSPSQVPCKIAFGTGYEKVARPRKCKPLFVVWFGTSVGCRFPVPVVAWEVPPTALTCLQSQPAGLGGPKTG